MLKSIPQLQIYDFKIFIQNPHSPHNPLLSLIHIFYMHIDQESH